MGLDGLETLLVSNGVSARRSFFLWSLGRTSPTVGSRSMMPSANALPTTLRRMLIISLIFYLLAPSIVLMNACNSYARMARICLSPKVKRMCFANAER